MNYQHAYHAGNFADVMKHCLLIQLLDQLSQKGKPFYALDAYGGRGLYSLASDEAKKTGEAQLGINKLLQADRRCPQTYSTVTASNVGKQAAVSLARTGWLGKAIRPCHRTGEQSQ